MRALLWRLTVAGNNKLYSCLHAKRPILIKYGISKTDFHKRPPYEISRKSVQWEPHWYVRTDRWTNGHEERNSRFSPLRESA